LRQEHIRYLVCPTCKQDLALAEANKQTGESIEEGSLECTVCKKTFPIVRHVPRFVPMENYASGFGFQWNKHSKTQYDSHSGAPVSETRFFGETKWPRKLPGEIILEVGSGSGRFTEQAASTGAMVVSLDYSNAVDANYASNGSKPNVLIVQGDIYQMPFREGYFDKVFCFGVLQHTPDVEKSFNSLPPYLKSGGSLVIDVYRKPKIFMLLFSPILWVRPITRKMQAEKLYKFCQGHVGRMWGISKIVNKIPYVGRGLGGLVMVPNYHGIYGLPDAMLKEWATLDLFDALSPAYTYQQSIPTVKQWFASVNMTDVEVHRGYNGIEGRGRKQ
jgi:SAM-dependent methyltransferase